MIALLGTFWTYSWGHDECIWSQKLSHLLCFLRRADNSISASVIRKRSQTSNLVLNRSINTNGVKRVLVHAGKNRNSYQLGTAGLINATLYGSLFCTLTTSSNHLSSSQAVNRENVCARKRCRVDSAFDLEWNIMHLEVKEHLEAASMHLVYHRGSVAIKERHANLNPTCMAGEKIGELQSSFSCAIKRNNNGVACLLVC